MEINPIVMLKIKSSLETKGYTYNRLDDFYEKQDEPQVYIYPEIVDNLDTEKYEELIVELDMDLSNIIIYRGDLKLSKKDILSHTDLHHISEYSVDNTRNVNPVVVQTVREMIEQRGYEIDSEDELFIIASSDEDKICFYKDTIQKLNVHVLREQGAIANEMNITHLILVYLKMTSTVKNIKMSEVGINIEFFPESSLTFNITKHELVPKHFKLSKTDADEIKRKYGTKHPILQQTDPVSKFYNYSSGDIIEITRKGGFVSYRIVR
jgi:DNA-directed RNA polymerase subunit H (RpoH/RPB5)